MGRVGPERTRRLLLLEVEMHLCGRSQTKELGATHSHPGRGPCSAPREAGFQALAFPFPRECGMAARAKPYMEKEVLLWELRQRETRCLLAKNPGALETTVGQRPGL